MHDVSSVFSISLHYIVLILVLIAYTCILYKPPILFHIILLLTFFPTNITLHTHCIIHNHPPPSFLPFFLGYVDMFF